MSLGEHLVEFRRRLFLSVAGIAITAVGGFFIADFVWAALSAPLEVVAESSSRLAQINYTSISEAFDTKLAIAITVGVVVSSPLWLWQIWAFITPSNEANVGAKSSTPTDSGCTPGFTAAPKNTIGT